MATPDATHLSAFHATRDAGSCLPKPTARMRALFRLLRQQHLHLDSSIDFATKNTSAPTISARSHLLVYVDI